MKQKSNQNIFKGTGKPFLTISYSDLIYFNYLSIRIIYFYCFFMWVLSSLDLLQ
jgi:hypothetical protein